MTPKERAAMKQALSTDEALMALEIILKDGIEHGGWPLNKNCEDGLSAITALREALDHSGEANEMVGCAYCNNPLFAGTKCNNCGRITLAEQADGEQWSPDDMAYRPSGLSMEQAEQEPFDMNDHPPHRLCECRKCMEYFTPLPDCDAFAASGKPIAEQTNTQFMEGYRIGLAEMREKCAKVCDEKLRFGSTGVLEADKATTYTALDCAAAIRAIKFEGDTGFRPVSEMIAEHKQDPKKAAAIEKAKMRKAKQEPVAIVNHEAGGSQKVTWLTLEGLADGAELYLHPVRTKDLMDEDFVQSEVKSLRQQVAALKAVLDAWNNVEQEPVAWVDLEQWQSGEYDCFTSEKVAEYMTPLYTTPVRKKDLTDDEIVSVLEYYDHEWDETTFAIARAVIAADRSKNGII